MEKPKGTILITPKPKGTILIVPKDKIMITPKPQTTWEKAPYTANSGRIKLA